MDAGSVREGMKVRDRHGERLGKIARRLDGCFIIEKGFLLPKEIAVRADQIAEVRDGVVWMRETGAALEAESYASPIAPPGAPEGSTG